MSSMEQGKNPPIDLIHASRTEANNYIGMPGQTTLLGDFTDGQTPRLLEARFHNGLLPGGFVLPLSPAPQGNDPQDGPPARVMNVPPAAYLLNQQVDFAHNFGYFPAVTLVNNLGQVVTAGIVHLSTDTVRVTFTTAGTYSLTIR